MRLAVGPNVKSGTAKSIGLCASITAELTERISQITCWPKIVPDKQTVHLDCVSSVRIHIAG